MMISSADRAYLPRQEGAADGVKAGGPHQDIADARLTLQTRSRGWYLKKSTRAFVIVFYAREKTDNFRRIIGYFSNLAWLEKFLFIEIRRVGRKM